MCQSLKTGLIVVGENGNGILRKFPIIGDDNETSTGPLSDNNAVELVAVIFGELNLKKPLHVLGGNGQYLHLQITQRLVDERRQGVVEPQFLGFGFRKLGDFDQGNGANEFRALRVDDTGYLSTVAGRIGERIDKDMSIQQVGFHPFKSSSNSVSET